jgi:hypothetical protein
MPSLSGRYPCCVCSLYYNIPQRSIDREKKTSHQSYAHTSLTRRQSFFFFFFPFYLFIFSFLSDLFSVLNSQCSTTLTLPSLMFFRRKPAKRDDDDDADIRTSPSLPELTAQGLSWPENLVDVAQIQQLAVMDPSFHNRHHHHHNRHHHHHHHHPQLYHHQGAAKTSISTVNSTPIPFHKPFRLYSGKPPQGEKDSDHPNDGNNAPISSLYMSNHPPPSVFDSWRSASGTHPIPTTRRRTRIPPTFNLMVRLSLSPLPTFAPPSPSHVSG